MIRFLAFIAALLLTSGARAQPHYPSSTFDSVAVANLQAASGKIGGSVLANMRCDGTTDDLVAARAAIATGAKTIMIPSTAAGCVVSGTLTPQSGQTITGTVGLSQISLVSASVSRLFDLTGLDSVTVTKLKMVGTNAAAGLDFFRLLNTTNSSVLGNVFVNAPGSLGAGSLILAQTSSGNTVRGNSFTGSAGNAAVAINGANGQLNAVDDNYFTGSVAFSVRILNGASRNSITNNRCYNSGIECYAVSIGSAYNRVIGNHGENAGDNCISIVGDHNIISENVCRFNTGAIYLWGSSNTVTGNVILDGGQGGNLNNCIGVGAAYGATAQNNTITGNVCDDDQVVPTQTGIVVVAPGYTTWTAGATVTTGPTSSYWMYGLNIYQAGASGTTGATPPTCTSGTCSDGTITWTYTNSFVGSLDPRAALNNNRVIRFAPSILGASPTYGLALKSRAINRNPDFLVSQPFSDNSVGAVGLATGALVVDGWRTNHITGSKLSYQRAAGISLANYQYAEAITSVSAYTPLATDRFQLTSRIEGIDIANLKWGTANALPLTLDACFNTTGITGKIPLVLDDAAANSFVTYANVTSAGAWQCFSMPIPGPTIGTWGTTNNQIGLRLSVGFGAGSDFTTTTLNQWQAGLNLVGPTDMAQVVSVNGAIVRMAAVHLYAANTEYLPRSYTEELLLAQHWYYSTFPARGVVSQNQGLNSAFCAVAPSAASFPSGFLQAPATMYSGITPTVTTFNPSATNANWRNVTASADAAVSVDPASARGAKGVLLTTTGTVANAGDVLCIHATIDSGL